MEGEKLALEILKNIAPMVVATIDENGFPHQRGVFNLKANDGVKVIRFATRSSSKKVKQIKNNSKGCIYLFDKEKFSTATFIGDFKVCDDLETKKKYWNDSFKNHGYKGVEDPEFCVIEMCTKKVIAFGSGKTKEWEVEQKKCCCKNEKK